MVNVIQTLDTGEPDLECRSRPPISPMKIRLLIRQEHFNNRQPPLTLLQHATVEFVCQRTLIYHQPIISPEPPISLDIDIV